MIDKTAASILPEEEPALGARTGYVRWTICAMLFAATTINYMDRQVLGLLKPTLMQSVANHGIGLTEESFATIVGFFTLFYAIGQLAAGRFVDKVGTRLGYMVIMAIWSLSAMGHALVNSVLQLGIARACLGLGESGNFPAANKTVAEWFPQKERSLAFGIFNCGANVGVILATLLVPIVTYRFGWHSAFLITGFFSASWILLWYIKYRKPANHPTLTGAELRLYLTRKPPREAGPVDALGQVIWLSARPGPMPSPNSSPIPSGGSISTGCRVTSVTDFISACSVSECPFLIVYNASAVGSIYGGYLPASFIRMGFSAARARLAAMLVCACLVVPVFLINYLQADNFGKWAAIGLLSLAAAAHQGFSANLFTTASDMFPRTAVGSVTGVGTMAGAVGGFLFAKFAGHVLQMSHSYSILFIFAACAYLISMSIMVALAPGLKKVEFHA